MDAVVQLIRNALCCVKDLRLFDGTFVHDHVYTHDYLGRFPEPMDQTTPLEVIISLTQLYASINTAKSGFRLVTSSIGKVRRIMRLVEDRLTKQSSTKTVWSDADRIINESLLKEARYAIRSIIIGMLLMPIGIAFFWLFLNSWHITSVDWFGGLPALIHALEVMELCLIPLLYFMIMDGMERLTKSKKTALSLQALQHGLYAPDQMGIATYETMTGWLPFWDGGAPMWGSVDAEKESTQLQDEIQTVQDQLSLWFPSSTTKGEKQDKLSKEALEEAEDMLTAAVSTMKMEGYREFVYFLLNFVAFYGYLMAPVAFYYEDETIAQPYHVQTLKLGYTNADADWTGNFAGDLMWTIEPVIILASPVLLAWMKPESKKKLKLA